MLVRTALTIGLLAPALVAAPQAGALSSEFLNALFQPVGALAEVAGEATDGGQDTAESTLPFGCGIPAAEGAPTGFNCGGGGSARLLSNCTDGPPRSCELELEVTASRRYWVNDGRVEVRIDGFCPAAESLAWTGLSGFPPRVVEARCERLVQLAEGQCEGGPITYAVTFTGDRAPRSWAGDFDGPIEYCG